MWLSRRWLWLPGRRKLQQVASSCTWLLVLLLYRGRVHYQELMQTKYNHTRAIRGSDIPRGSAEKITDRTNTHLVAECERIAACLVLSKPEVHSRYQSARLHSRGLLAKSLCGTIHDPNGKRSTFPGTACRQLQRPPVKSP